MKQALILTVLISGAHAFTLPEEARTKTQEAILAIPKVRKARKATEKVIYRSVANTTGLSKRQLATSVAVAKSAADQRISTSDLRIRFRALGASITPSLDYSWRDDTTQGSVQLNWSW